MIEVYEWPEGGERTTDVAIDILEIPVGGPFPQIGDTVAFPNPMVTDDAHFVEYRVVDRVLMWFSASRDDDGQDPAKYTKTWIYVRRVDPL